MEECLKIGDHPVYTRQAELDDGTAILLRPMRSDDLERMLLFFRELPQRCRCYFKQEAARVEVLGQWCKQLDYDRVLPILAVAGEGEEERVLADATLHIEPHGRSAHVARIRWVVADDMRGRGVGRLLVQELLNLAHDRGISKIQASVLSHDRPSIRLLYRLGFKKEALFKRHAMDLNGRLYDVVVMFNDYEQQWLKMDDLNIDSDFCQKP